MLTFASVRHLNTPLDFESELNDIPILNLIIFSVCADQAEFP